MSLLIKVQSVMAAQPSGAAPFQISAVEGDQSLTCEFDARDTLSCSLLCMVLATDRLATATPNRLRALADALSRRIHYLLEPIRPIELDEVQCVMQMRSHPPHQGEDGSSYYELAIKRGGELSLRRWHKSKGSARAPLPATVTLEVLWRLVGDFSAVAGQA